MVDNGEFLAVGGNVLHRAPMAFVRELVREEKEGLRLIKTAGAMDMDLLCAERLCKVGRRRRIHQL